MHELLKDFNTWGSSNSNFSLFDYIHTQLSTTEANPELCFAFLELCWPTFIEHEGCVFLKETFEESKYEDLKNREKARSETEYWMNINLIEPYFEDYGDDFTLDCAFVEKLALIWEVKLAHDFPKRRFTVDFNLMDYESSVDVYISFYQKEKRGVLYSLRKLGKWVASTLFTRHQS